MRCALVPTKYTGLKALFTSPGFENAGFDRGAISFVRQQTWQVMQTQILSAVAAGGQLWESRMRFPSLASPGGNCRPVASGRCGFSRCQQRRPISLSLGQYCPCHASQFVGQGNRRQIMGDAGSEMPLAQKGRLRSEGSAQAKARSEGGKRGSRAAKP